MPEHCWAVATHADRSLRHWEAWEHDCIVIRIGWAGWSFYRNQPRSYLALAEPIGSFQAMLLNGEEVSIKTMHPLELKGWLCLAATTR